MDVSQLLSTSVQRDELRGRVPKRIHILDLSKTRDMNQAHIAKSVGCTDRYVCKVLSKASSLSKQAEHGEEQGAASKRKWYEDTANNHLASVRAAILVSATVTTTNSTNLLNPSSVRDLTDEEEKANTFPHDLYSNDPIVFKRGQAFVRHHLSGKKQSSLGFLLMDAHAEGDAGSPKSSGITPLLELVDKNPRYGKEMKPIFQTLQAAKGQQNGDTKRRQAKMSDLAGLAELRKTEAEGQVTRLERAAAAAAGRSAARAFLKKGNKRLGAEAFSVPIRKKRRVTNVKASSTLEKAQQILKEVQAEYEIACKALDYMCRGYERIRKVRPF